MGVIFLDFKRAFETIDRNRLIKKLYNYGIRDKVLEWFRSYLDNRMQRVKIKNLKSKCVKTKYDVSQGSVLGPLLFILYINNIIQLNNNVNVV